MLLLIKTNVSKGAVASHARHLADGRTIPVAAHDHPDTPHDSKGHFARVGHVETPKMGHDKSSNLAAIHEHLKAVKAHHDAGTAFIRVGQGVRTTDEVFRADKAILTDPKNEPSLRAEIQRDRRKAYYAGLDEEAAHKNWESGKDVPIRWKKIVNGQKVTIHAPDKNTNLDCVCGHFAVAEVNRQITTVVHLPSGQVIADLKSGGIPQGKRLVVELLKVPGDASSDNWFKVPGRQRMIQLGKAFERYEIPPKEVRKGCTLLIAVSKGGNWPHSEACLMLNLNEDASDILRDWADKTIAPEDVEPSEGLEKHPRITVKYGIRAPVEEIVKIVRDFGPVKAEIGKLSAFKTEAYDVLKWDVKSPDLMRLNELICKLPHIDTYPKYVPHLTAGYVKSGTSGKYVGARCPLCAAGKDTNEQTFTTMEYSGTDDQKAYIPLAGGVKKGMAFPSDSHYQRTSAPASASSGSLTAQDVFAGARAHNSPAVHAQISGSRPIVHVTVRPPNRGNPYLKVTRQAHVVTPSGEMIPAGHPESLETRDAGMDHHEFARQYGSKIAGRGVGVKVSHQFGKSVEYAPVEKAVCLLVVCKGRDVSGEARDKDGKWTAVHGPRDPKAPNSYKDAGGNKVSLSTPIATLAELHSLVAEASIPVYLRWTRSIDNDAKSGWMSKDHDTGAEERGLSAVELLKSDDSLMIAKRLLEYGHPRKKVYVLAGEQTCRDSDGYPSLVNVTPVAYIKSSVMDEAFEAINASYGIAKARRVVGTETPGFDFETAHPRESTAHDGKRPGEFAKKEGAGGGSEAKSEPEPTKPKDKGLHESIRRPRREDTCSEYDDPVMVPAGEGIQYCPPLWNGYDGITAYQQVNGAYTVGMKNEACYGPPVQNLERGSALSLLRLNVRENEPWENPELRKHLESEHRRFVLRAKRNEEDIPKNVVKSYPDIFPGGKYLSKSERLDRESESARKRIVKIAETVQPEIDATEKASNEAGKRWAAMAKNDPERDKAWTECRKLTTRYQFLKDKMNYDIRNKIGFDHGKTIKHGIDARTPEWKSRQWSQEVESFSRLIPEELINSIPMSVRIALYEVAGDTKDKTTRSHYSGGRTLWDDTCYITSMAQNGTIVHELGHHIEARSLPIHEAAIQFLRERQRGGGPENDTRKLKDIIPNSNYDDDEWAFKDKFIHPYIGKSYPNNSASEVISMGVQYLYEDPVKLATEDPDFFRFIYRTLRSG